MRQNRLISHSNVGWGLLVTINDAGHMALTTNSSSGPLAGFAAGCGLNCNDFRHEITPIDKARPAKGLPFANRTGFLMIPSLPPGVDRCRDGGPIGDWSGGGKLALRAVARRVQRR